MKALIIEDDPHNSELLKLRLEGLNCQVLVADKIDAAIRLAVEQRPDLVFVDLQMNADNSAGLQVIRELRSRPETSGTAIIVHSVFFSRQAEMPHEFPEVEGLLPKPFTVKQLKVIVEGTRVLLNEGVH